MEEKKKSESLKEYHKEYYKRNREKIIKRATEYNKTHRDRVRETSHKYEMRRVEKLKQLEEENRKLKDSNTILQKGGQAVFTLEKRIDELLEENKKLKEMGREKKAEYETLLRCFNTVIFYNGYSDFFRDVYGLFRKYMEEGGAEKHEGYFSILERLRDAELDRFAYGQIQALRMMLVEMFGECGTSPRSGWITDEQGFDEFMSDLIKNLAE